MKTPSCQQKFVARAELFVPILLVAILLVAAWGRTVAATSSEGKDAVQRTTFTDIAGKLGVDHRHHTPVFDAKVEKVMPWITAGGAGVSVGDFDNDGWDDLYVVDSRDGHLSALYRNLGNWRFEDIAVQAGVATVNDASNIATGALWLDYDNDGALDLFVMRFGRSLLFKGDGKGHFQDVTARSGLSVKHQNLLAGITFDYDNDGRLDLLVGGYFGDDVDLFRLETTRILHDSFESARNGGTLTLYRNLGGGKFADVTSAAGLADTGWTLALGHGDLDNDGRQDIYVANDFGPDKIFHNQGGRFVDITQAAVGTDTKKGMAAEFGDYNNDGYVDIYVTNITSEVLRECNMLWLNNGDGTLTDVSVETGTCDSGWGWGAKFFDADNDGLQDLYALSGFLSGESKEDYWLDLAELATAPDLDVADVLTWPNIGDKSLAGYEPNRFFRNNGGHMFEEVGATVGLDDIRDGRGVSVGDFDNDGSMDLYVTNCNQTAGLYRNNGEEKNNWLQLKLIGVKSNRDAVGAKAILKTEKGTQIREVNGGNGFSSQSTFRLHFGLGGAARIESLEILWPSGIRQKVEVPSINRLLKVTESSASME